MEKIHEENNKFFTEEGLKALLNKTRSLVEIFNDNVFPRKVIILDFGTVIFQNKEQCEERIKQMCMILGLKYKKLKEKSKDKQGNIIEKEVII